MKTTSFLDYILYDLFGNATEITYRPMMGGFILYYEDSPFALVHDETLYYKGSKETKAWYEERGGKQFFYTKQGKDVYLYYFSVPEEVIENSDVFDEWMSLSLSVKEN